MGHRHYRFHATASVFAIAAWAAGATPAMAQAGNAAAAQPVEAVTVTGTSIRGTAPVGANVTTVTTEDIKATGATSV